MKCGLLFPLTYTSQGTELKCNHQRVRLSGIHGMGMKVVLGRREPFSPSNRGTYDSGTSLLVTVVETLSVLYNIILHH
ncbi:hypothetical protein BDW69DRAFT_173719 [Aspergillus filifer]